MTIAVTKVERVQRVVKLVEEILAEIASEHSEPRVAAPAIAEFFTDVSLKIAHVSHEYLGALLRQKHQPGD